MKLIAVCFLTILTCVLAQQSGVATTIYKAGAAPAREIIKSNAVANIPGTQLIMPVLDFGENVAGMIDRGVASVNPFVQVSAAQSNNIFNPVDFLNRPAQSPSNNAFNPMDILNRLAQSGQSMTQGALGASQNMLNTAQNAANGIFTAGQGAINPTLQAAQQTMQGALGFGQRVSQQTVGLGQQVIDTARDVSNSTSTISQQAIAAGQEALNLGLNATQQAGQTILNTVPAN